MGKEWDKNNMATVTCRVRKNDAQRFSALAQRLHTTPHAILSRYVREAVTSDGLFKFSASDAVKVLAEEKSQLAQENASLKEKLKATEDDLKHALNRAEQAEKLVTFFKSK